MLLLLLLIGSTSFIASTKASATCVCVANLQAGVPGVGVSLFPLDVLFSQVVPRNEGTVF